MIEMETCGKHLAPNMQTISSIFKGALTTFRIETKTFAILDLRFTFAMDCFITVLTLRAFVRPVTPFAILNLAMCC